jgi:DNA-directed RNA polymerase III subunit RPC4
VPDAGGSSTTAIHNLIESDSDSDQSDSGGVDRLNIDRMDLTGEDVEEEGASFVLPVRMIRLEHQDRTTQSITKTEDVQAKEEDVDEDLTLDDNSTGTTRKPKNKIRDLDSSRAQRPWVGVFPEEELDYPNASAGRQPPSRSSQDSRRSPKVKEAHKRGFRDRPVGWNTKEHHEEWDRTLVMMDTMVNELQRPEYARRKSGETIPEDAPEDITKSGQVYLFQFPSTMPPLVPQSQLDTSSTTENVDDKDIKEKWLKDQRLKLKDQKLPPFINNRPDHLPKAGGRVGKLRVYKSGKTEIDWGGMPFKLKTGIVPEFSQEAVLVRSNDKPTADRDGYIGSAYSFGEVKSKFIVVPDLAKFFPTLESDTE